MSRVREPALRRAADEDGIWTVEGGGNQGLTCTRLAGGAQC